MEGNSQENVIEVVEHTDDTKIGADRLSSEEKDDILNRSKNHRENISSIIVPQYEEDDYVVTYSRVDKSILLWKEVNGQHQPDVFKESVVAESDSSSDLRYF